MTKKQKRPSTSRPVMEKARAQVARLMAGFHADPAGQTARMTRTMLLGCMVKEQTQDEERHSHELQGHKEARNLLEEGMRTLAVGRLNDHDRHCRLADKLRKAGTQHDEIGGHVQARKALAEKRPFDYDRALEQISAMIGLRGGEEFESGEAREPDRDPAGYGPVWEEEQRIKRERHQRLLEQSGFGSG